MLHDAGLSILELYFMCQFLTRHAKQGLISAIFPVFKVESRCNHDETKNFYSLFDLVFFGRMSASGGAHTHVNVITDLRRNALI